MEELQVFQGIGKFSLTVWSNNRVAVTTWKELVQKEVLFLS